MQQHIVPCLTSLLNVSVDTDVDEKPVGNYLNLELDVVLHINSVLLILSVLLYTEFCRNEIPWPSKGTLSFALFVSFSRVVSILERHITNGNVTYGILVSLYDTTTAI